ncbi:hypothetical protein ALNOE001_15370 [Candidatus Methanobinarius endosymbioticus]|uniref:Uncharacterized protein n=1 Tax=Candidatus Methanobinarius endosymbioticus TaxID=2006182 RepID=A0A366M9B5_9EURY|nr:hypothetical protein ALNOE001_15370 [Candidatus Methanobinarius endosymbioticus]
MKKILILLPIVLISFSFIASISATLNVMVITDPTGEDANGAAGGSMSFAQNMFQSTFLMSKENQFVVLSGGEGDSNNRLRAIVDSISQLENGATVSVGTGVASGYIGIRLMVGGPSIGAAVGGSFDAYLITVEDDDSIKITPYSGGLAVLPPGEKGAIIHLRNSVGNPQHGTATQVRRETALNIGRMIRDGYSATVIVGEVFKEVAEDSGEKYGGGAVNLVTGISTGAMFTPEEINTTGYPMDEPYVKVCPNDGWSAGYPSAENYEACPIDGSKFKVVYAYDALIDAITVTQDSVSVSIYGSETPGLSETTSEVVKASVKKYGYDVNAIADSINKGIRNGLLVGVNYVEPKNLNVKAESKAVGVYYTPLSDGRTSPPWNLPISSFVLNILGSIQTAIGIILVLLVVFRSRLLQSFQKR